MRTILLTIAVLASAPIHGAGRRRGRPGREGRPARTANSDLRLNRLGSVSEVIAAY